MFIGFLLLLLISQWICCEEIWERCPSPFERNRSTTKVELNLRIYSMENFDDVEGILSVRASLIAKWNDPCVWKLATKLWPNTTAASNVVLLDEKYSWKPSIVQDNSRVFLTWSDADLLPIEVLNDGSVYLWVAKHWETKCPGMKLGKFPFDKHVCSISFYIWDNIEITEVTKAKFDVSSSTLQNFPNHLFNFKTTNPVIRKIPFPCGNNSCFTTYISFPVELERRWYPYYFHGLFIPQLTLTMLQLSAFIIPSNRMERCEFSVTLFVAYAVTRSEVQSYIPKTTETILILLATNIAMIGSMAATCYFTICVYLRKTKWFDKKCLVCIDRVIFAIFIIFYVVLYMVTIISISSQ